MGFARAGFLNERESLRGYGKNAQPREVMSV